jgi:uncharacterized membrane protein
MRALTTALSACFLLAQPVYACANAMEGGSGLNESQLVLLAACLLGVMFFVGLYLRSQSKLRAQTARKRFKDLDGEA